MKKIIADVTVNEVKNLLDEHTPIKILDVRTPHEFARGKIKGSINIPLENIKTCTEKVVTDKDQHIYVYCLSGARSSMAVSALQQMGYTHVYNIHQGLLAWRAHKFPIQL